MIQRLASKLAAPSICLLSLICGCGAHPGTAIPRTLAGAPTRGAFVPPSSYEAFVRGELLLAEGRAAEAARAFELATTAPDEDAYLLARLGLAQLRAGDRDAAMHTLAHAARIDDCAEEVWLTRGALAEDAHDLEGAQIAYARAADCAPRSPAGLLALARLRHAHGDDAGALADLMRAAERPYGDRLEPTIARALADAEPAALAHALSSLGNHRATGEQELAEALTVALRKGLPRVALRGRAQHATRLPTALEAEILRANDQREALAALIGTSSADALGGAATTARLALAAGAYERAELEAANALMQRDSDELRALRGEALLGLGKLTEAIAEAQAIRDPARRRDLTLKLLARSGAPALAAELAKRASGG